MTTSESGCEAPVLDINRAAFRIKELEHRTGIALETLSLRRVTHRQITSRRIQLPETRLIQYDCGKLQTLHQLISQKLKPKGIFLEKQNWNLSVKMESKMFSKNQSKIFSKIKNFLKK